MISAAYHGPDPYTATAIFASEVALILARTPSSSKTGVVTTAYGLGDVLLDRLRKVEGMKFSLEGTKKKAKEY